TATPAASTATDLDVFTNENGIGGAIRHGNIEGMAYRESASGRRRQKHAAIRIARNGHVVVVAAERQRPGCGTCRRRAIPRRVGRTKKDGHDLILAGDGVAIVERLLIE